MGKQLNPLEKEFLVKTYKAKVDVKLDDFCGMNDVSTTAMRNWIRQYDEGGQTVFIPLRPKNSK